MNQQDVFLNLLIAAMSDAAVGGTLTQLKTTIDPDGKGVRYVRIVVIPEALDLNFDRPLGSTDA